MCVLRAAMYVYVCVVFMSISILCQQYTSRNYFVFVFYSIPNGAQRILGMIFQDSVIIDISSVELRSRHRRPYSNL